MNLRFFIFRILIKGVITFFRGIPQGLIAFIGLGIGWVLHHIIRFRYRVIYDQLHMVYKDTKSNHEIELLIKGIYRHLGMTLIELLRLPGITREEISKACIFHGIEHAEKAFARKKGILVLTGHIGNWELIGSAWVKKGYKINAITKELKTREGDFLAQLMREDNGVQTIPRRNSLKTILRILKKNEAIAIMIDQNMKENEGVFVDFLGYPACTMVSLAVLAARSGAAIIPAYIYRDTDLKHHHLVLLPEVTFEQKYDNTKENIMYNTRCFNKVLEQIIHKHPDQWLWIHKRWKERPRNEREFPIDYANM